MHLQAPARFLSEQIALVPHGDGLQGLGLSVSTLGGTAKLGDKKVYNYCLHLHVVILWQATKAFPV